MIDATALPIWVNIGIFIGAGVLVWFAGSRLASYADRLAEITGLGVVIIGMIMLGAVTSLPEITIATASTLQGEPLLSISDVLGSTALNVAILAVADAAFGRDALTGIQGSARVMMQGVMGIVIMALAVAAFVVGDVLIFGVGAWSWLMFAVYLGAMVLLSQAGQKEAWRPARRRDQPKEQQSAESDDSVRGLVLRAVAVATCILVAGVLLADTGTAIAEQTGLGVGFFGAVFLAMTTSMPEVSTTIGMVRRKQYEMAISGIFGTNLFNVTIIVLVDALHPGKPVLPEVGRSASVAALIGIVLTSIYLVGLIERRNRVFLRMGYDSIAVVLAYVSGLAVLYAVR